MKRISILLIICCICLSNSVISAAGYSSTDFSASLKAPNAPQLYSPPDQSADRSTSPTLSWSTVPGAVWYRVLVAYDTLFNYIASDTTVTSTYRQVYGLDHNRKYFWRVRALDSTSGSPWSQIWAFTTVVAIPPVPVQSSPANGAVGQPQNLLLKWYNSEGAKIYTVEMASDTFFNNRTHYIDTITSSSVQLSNLKYGMKYFWRVNAYNRGGLSNWSEIWRFSVTLPQTALSAPVNTSSNQPVDITLKWKPVEFADSYQLQVSTYPAFTSIYYEDPAVKETFKDLKNLSNNTTFYWRVRARQGSNAGIFSDTWNFTTIKAVPDVPVLSSPADGSTFQPVNITLMWNTAPNALTYRLQLSEAGDFSNLLFDDSSITATSKEFYNLKNGTKYYWRVSSKNPAGNSQFSQTCTFVTLMLQPEGLAASSYGIKKVKLTWTDKSDNEAGFLVERKLTTGDFKTADTAKANTTAFIDSTVLTGTTYIYRIRSFNKSAISQYSNEAEVTTITAVETPDGMPSEFELYQNHPNPFNPSTTISYAIPFESNVKLTVYNSLGKVIRELVNGIERQGVYLVKFDASDMPSGLYFYAIEARSPYNGQEFKSVKKMLLVK